VASIEKQKLIPGATVDYKPDGRQKIAEGWPYALDDTTSFEDWGWKYNVNIDDLASKIYNGIDA